MESSLQGKEEMVEKEPTLSNEQNSEIKQERNLMENSNLNSNIFWMKQLLQNLIV